MWIVSTICSEPSCAAEGEFVVSTIEEIEALVCECGYCVTALSIANFEPVHGKASLRLVSAVPGGSRDELLAA